MKRSFGGALMPVWMLALGIAGLALRKALYALAVDAKGLLVRSHPLEIALAVLTAAVLAAIVLAARKLEGSGMDRAYPAANLLGAVGNVAAGAGILVTVLNGTPAMGGYLGSAWRILALAAPLCFLLAGIARVFGKKPFFLLHVVACLFFVLHIVTRYQLWSGHPQMQDYVFSLLGAMALMFFSFYTAAMEADCENLPMTVAMGLAAVYFCTAELARSSCPGLYLGGILWVLTDLCSIRKLPPN